MLFLALIPFMVLVVGIIKFVVLGILVLGAAVFFKLAFRIMGYMMRLVFGHPSRCYAPGRMQATVSRAMPPRPVMMRQEIRPPQRPPARPIEPVPNNYQIPSRPARREVPSWSLFAAGIIFFCLVALGFRSFREEYSKSSTKEQGSSTNLTSQWSVIGRGDTEENARLNALDKSKDQLTVYLHNLNPPVEWVPSDDFIEKSLKLEWEKQVPEERYIHEGLTHKVRLVMEVTPKNRNELWSMDKSLRIEQRQFSVLKILAVVVAVLLAVAGYVRLDEWSKGYYTTWLRLGAASIVGAAGAGIWLLMQH
jgi:hypothetical protein